MVQPPSVPRPRPDLPASSATPVVPTLERAETPETVEERRRRIVRAAEQVMDDNAELLDRLSK